MKKPLEDRDEILFCSDNKEMMLSLRNAVAKKFRRTWLCLYNSRGKFGLEVSNSWGGALPSQKRLEVEEFIEKFMIEYRNEKELDKKHSDG